MVLEPSDYVLEDIIRRMNSGSEDAIRDAFRYMEVRLREAAGLSSEYYGTRLIQQVFHPDTGLLQPYSASEEERRGIHELYQGVFKYYRNPVSHRYLGAVHSDLMDLRMLIEHMFALMDQAIVASMDINRFLGLHEGSPSYMKTYRIDIDDDGANEIIVLMQTAPVARPGERQYQSHFTTLILDSDKGKVHRVPAEAISGNTMYGPIGVRTEYITSSVRPELVVTWTSGESGSMTYFLRWESREYKLISIGTLNSDGKPEVKSRSIGMRANDDLQFVDFDGDGITEIELTRMEHSDDADRFGLKVEDVGPNRFFKHCRVMKWNDTSNFLEEVWNGVAI